MKNRGNQKNPHVPGADQAPDPEVPEVATTSAEDHAPEVYGPVTVPELPTPDSAELKPDHEPPLPEPEPQRAVHPLAAKLPLLEGEALEALAESIRINGLRHPIVVDKNGRVLDGRNRLAACKLAGVEPTFITFDGDPVEYIVDAAVVGRSMNKGQRAMFIAMAYPESPEKGGRGKRAVLHTGVSGEYVKQARAVLRYAPDLAEKVMTLTDFALSAAFKTASEMKSRKEHYDQMRQRVGEPAASGTSVLAKFAAALATPETSFIDEEDFIRAVRFVTKEVIEHMTRMTDGLTT